MRGSGPDGVSVVGPTRGLTVGFLLLQYSFVYIVEFLFFISVLYLDLFLIGDDTSMSLGSFMRTKHLFVLIHI